MVKQELTSQVSGIVERFAGNGRKLSYPTANIKTPVSLDDGIYFGFADLAQYTNHPALIFVGTPRTLGGNDWRIEAHLLDIDDKDYYGHTLKLRTHKYHRGNKSFGSVEKLIEAMKADEAAARDWFKQRSE